MTPRLPATFRRGQIVSRAKAIQAEAKPNSWPYCLFWALHEVSPPRDAAATEYWEMMRKTFLSALREHEEKFRYSVDDVPLPADMARYLAEALTDLSEGEQHPLLERRVPSGGRGNIRSRQKQECVDAAVDYLVAADLGVVDDERSRTTVAQQYGVTKKQIHRWLAARGRESRRRKELEERWTKRLAYDHDPKRTMARMVRKLMRSYGEEFRSLRRPAR